MARILVALHHLELGGSQLNALDLALAVRDRGHDVTVFGVHRGAPGPVAAMVRDAGLPLELVPADPVQRPFVPVRPAVVRRMREVVRTRQIDLVHTYEYPMTLDAFYGAHLGLGTALVCTIYGMDVPRWLPRDPAMVVGTRDLADLAGSFRGRPALLIEPPVNTATDDPAVVDAPAFRAEHGIGPDDTVVGVVSRLEPDMKAEGIARAMRAVGILAPGMDAGERLRLLVVGDGPSRAELGGVAEQVNDALGYRAVVMTGALGDPRAAYAAADIALGMGGSALRAMAFAKPLVVLGIQGFSRPFTEDTAEEFFTAGFYGIGGGAADDPGLLAAQLRALLDAGAGERARLGAFSRQVVLERFSLALATERLDAAYADALAHRPGRSRVLAEAARTAGYRGASELLSERVKGRIRPLLRRPQAASA